MRSAVDQARGATRNDPRTVGCPGLELGRDPNPASGGRVDLDADGIARTNAIRQLINHGVSDQTAQDVCVSMRPHIARRLTQELARMELLPPRKRLTTESSVNA